MSDNLKFVKAGPLRVMAFGQVGNAPAIGDDRTTASEKWVKFGARNLFPEYCRALADSCSPLDACVNKMAQFIAGTGVDFLDANGEPMNDAIRVWQELTMDMGEGQLLEATALDIALMNTFSWEAVNTRLGVGQLFHMDVCRVRAAKKADGVIPAYFFSSNWMKYTQAGYKPEEIKAWGTPGAPKTLIYRRWYKQLRDYYGEPHWLAAMADAEVLARIPVFNRTQIEGGFKPAIHAHLQTNKDDSSLDQIDENFELTFMGDDGKPYILTVGSTEETLTITKLERGDHAGELDRTRAVSKEEIYHSYGIPPILMGVEQKTGLSGKGLAITEELSLFQTTSVRPRQRMIEDTIKMVLMARGIMVPQVKIRPLVPFEPAADPALVRMTYLRSTKVNEDRIARKMEPLPDTDPRGELMLIEVTASQQDQATNTDTTNG